LGILAKNLQTTPSGVERIYVDFKNIANGTKKKIPPMIVVRKKLLIATSKKNNP